MLGRALAKQGWEILSTGGTARVLADAGVAVTEVAVVTGHPEMMDGRVKTLHPAIHAGLLARREHPDDMAELERQGYGPIDLVAVNLYPFRETIAAPDVTPALAMENVDIGGPTLIRAAAKNHRDVWVVVDPDDYGAVLEAVSSAESAQGEGGSVALRRRLAARVFREISAYDQAIAGYLEGLGESDGVRAETGDNMPERVTLELERRDLLRYGENPGQDAAFYAATTRSGHGIAGLEQLHGKSLSYNNLLDLDGAL
ncbi:MAG: bifunctional phosphoribosylaminoimidazolecarboxamide formyltransferase/IMP cyclohydrolase, partial [Gemmatimonadota bacterium]|nr:bifunctional phosphoribosylaminoimidazolecarboxamide formyltransferase/IMP cyclohydrolase [Gemmatimonadota bacterium]